MGGAFSYDELDEMEDVVNRATDGPWEVSCPEGEEWRQQAYDFAFISLARSSMPRLIAELRLYMKSNEELQSLDGLQQLAIERLNKQVDELRGSLRLIEDQYNLLLSDVRLF